VAAEQLAFARELDDRTALVALNAADLPVTVTVETRANGPEAWRDALNGGEWRAEDGRLRVEIPPSWGRVLVGA